MFKKISLVTLLTLGTLSASDTVKPMLQMGYDWGGTELATVQHENYDAYGYRYNDSSYKIRAGEGLSFEAGAVLGNDNSNMELQFLVGYKFDSDSANNGDVTWDVIPFTALAMFKSNKWKFGGGVTYHLNPELDSSFPIYDKNNNFVSNGMNDKYENAFGGVVKMQYRITPSFDVGVKGTFIDYKLKDDSSVTADGNSIGFVLSYSFGNERSEFR
jgi:hypothetical protein